MKRLNPDTGNIFTRGEYRDDGFRFWAYRKQLYKKSSYNVEIWRSSECFETELKRINSWHSKNPDKLASYAATCRAKRTKRKPKWIKDVFQKEINVIYRRAQLATIFMGVQYEVDHIEPMNGKDRSGLHVPWNLDLLTEEENQKKGNRRAC